MSAKKDKHRLTPHQRRVVEAKIRKPEATLKEVGVRAGYRSSPAQHAHQALKSPHVQTRLAELMEKHPRQELKFERLLHTLADGLGATEIKVFQDKGKIVESPPYVDHDARHAYLRTAFQLRGDLKPENGNGNGNGLYVELRDDQLALIAIKKAKPTDFLRQPEAGG